MSEPEIQQPEKPSTNGWFEPGRNNVLLVYILYLVSFALGITFLIGVVFAYINRPNARGWVESHYVWAIRTFWICLLYSFVSLLLTFVVIGVFGFIATAIWLIARVIIGLQKASASEPIAKPTSWLI
ncbi:hypothetical protein [Martelella sp. HB161492]|uniref:DUF4870 family protein n=1 Tax=Martelella sp. HB161492 TaxID=2720726 RepID=UPI0015906F94|nr:hypothetical protein [Martelella sp. HB161492]